jgi:hypothetical protein
VNAVTMRQLRGEVDELRAIVDGLRAELAREVRTERLVVVHPEDGRELVATRVLDGSVTLQVRWDEQAPQVSIGAGAEDDELAWVAIEDASGMQLAELGTTTVEAGTVGALTLHDALNGQDRQSVVVQLTADVDEGLVTTTRRLAPESAEMTIADTWALLDANRARLQRLRQPDVRDVAAMTGCGVCDECGTRLDDEQRCDECDPPVETSGALAVMAETDRVMANVMRRLDDAEQSTGSERAATTVVVGPETSAGMWADLMIAETAARGALHHVTRRALIFLDCGMPLDRALDAMRLDPDEWPARVEAFEAWRDENRRASARLHFTTTSSRGGEVR